MAQDQSTPETITPADYVISKFGGLTATARALGKPVSTVQGWSERGTIRQEHWKEIIAAAKARDRLLTYEDFINHHPAPKQEQVA